MSKGQNHNHLARARQVASHTKEEWYDLIWRFHYRCVRCCQLKSKAALTKDHITPLSKGGTDGIDNIQPLCAPCNSRKGNRATDYRGSYMHWYATRHKRARKQRQLANLTAETADPTSPAD